MASTFDLDTESDGDAGGVDPIDLAKGLIEDHLATLDPKSAMAKIKRLRNCLTACEARALAPLIPADGNTARAARAAGSGGQTSSKTRNAAASRAKAVAGNAALADKVSNNELSEDQLDVIADASRRTDGAAATDDDFIDKIAGVDPDRGARIADDYVADSKDASGIQSEHDRLRALRNARIYNSKATGLNVINLEGDGVAVTNSWQAINKLAKQYWKTDGGRDLPADQHPRTFKQCLFDAAHDLLTGSAAKPDATKPANTAGSVDIVIKVELDKLLGVRPDLCAEQIGVGPIADSVLAAYLAGGANLIGALFDNDGQPLWWGRKIRYATHIQMLALVVRDKSCVLCGANWQDCQAHHTTPWSAPAQGETDIDKLVLLCGRCHRNLHTNNRTIYRTINGWQTRPALPHETPRPRPRREPRQQE